ncbi:hypothetical protein [Actinoplanes sp. NPDC049802]|uniref:hypothetical protein n=1 Tax=Actinoplanes sp. NPDC049802 TaxID=3154742 RepID=UPI0033E776C3
MTTEAKGPLGAAAVSSGMAPPAGCVTGPPALSGAGPSALGDPAGAGQPPTWARGAAAAA